MLMTHRHICIAPPLRQRGPLVPCTRQWGPLQIGCPQTDSASTPRKPNSSGWAPGSSWQNLDALSAEFPTMSFSQVVRNLGVLLDSELTFSHHIDQLCRSCYYQLRQLRVIARSLTFNAAVSLVHAFVFSHLDYCSSIFVGLPGVRMEKLRWVHRAAARLIGGFRKFDHISHYMRNVLHWLPFPQCIFYRIASLVWRCLSGWAPSYLRELCRPLSSCSGRRALQSSAHGNLVVLFARSLTMQTRSFSVVGPKTRNGLPVDLRHLPNGACSQFQHLLKTVLFSLGLGRERLRVGILKGRYINFD